MKECFFSFCIYLTLFSANISEITNLPKNHNKLPIFNKDKYVYLISCPYSGNTYCRFLIEYLLNIPTSGYGKRIFPSYINHIVNYPIASILDFPIDYSKPPILKNHWFTDIYLRDGSLQDGSLQDGSNIDSKAKVIFILRDPIRHYKKHSHLYYTLLRDFNDWEGEKILIYFEDLMENPLKETFRIAQFLNQPIVKTRVTTFHSKSTQLSQKLYSLKYPHQPIKSRTLSNFKKNPPYSSREPWSNL